MTLKKSILYSLLLITLLVGGKMLFHSVPFYEVILKSYASLLGNASAAFLTLTGNPSSYELASDALVMEGGKAIAIQNNLALKFYVYMAAILIPFSTRNVQSVLYFIAASIILFLVAVARNAGLILVYERMDNLVMAVSYLFRFTLVWWAIVYRIQLHTSLTKKFEVANQRFNERFQISLRSLLFLVLVSTSLMTLIDQYLIQADTFVAESLSALILAFSENLLHAFNFRAVIDGNYIWLGNVWVFLGTPCLGIGVMALFAVLILIIRSHWINKLIYIALGWIILIGMNAVRVVYILHHLYKNGDYTLNLEAHDLSNYFFYSVVFILLMIYIYWFQDINFNLKNKWHAT